MNVESPEKTLERWRRIVERVAGEVQSLDTSERRWAVSRLDEISALQVRMHERFLAAGGSEQCLLCQGRCCDCGHNHFTLVNLLGFLTRGERPPEPDFSRPCPFLGKAGCRLDVGRRPYNCVTFICEQVEGRMRPADREAFYAEDIRLRRCHSQFDSRYALSSPRGVLIRSARLEGGAFLVRPDDEGPKPSADSGRVSRECIL